MGPSKSGENALGCNPCLSLLGILAWITVNFLTGNTFLSVSLRLWLSFTHGRRAEISFFFPVLFFPFVKKKGGGAGRGKERQEVSVYNLTSRSQLQQESFWVSICLQPLWVRSSGIYGFPPEQEKNCRPRNVGLSRKHMFRTGSHAQVSCMATARRLWGPWTWAGLPPKSHSCPSCRWVINMKVWLATHLAALSWR